MADLGGQFIAGLVAGLIIGKVTEIFTSHDYAPTRAIAKQAQTGPATVIIEGIAVGMESTAIPVITIVAAGRYQLLPSPVGQPNPLMGLYGSRQSPLSVCWRRSVLPSLQMLMDPSQTTPVETPKWRNSIKVSENARISWMHSVTQQPQTGKGFAIGSAALTALALLAAYLEEIRYGLIHLAGKEELDIDGKGTMVDTLQVSVSQFMDYYDVTLMNPQVLIGLFIGAVMAFYFCALTMKAVGRAAGAMVEEVRRQFRERTRYHERRRKTRLRTMCRNLNSWCTTGNDFSITHRHHCACRCRSNF